MTPLDQQPVASALDALKALCEARKLASKPLFFCPEYVKDGHGETYMAAVGPQYYDEATQEKLAGDDVTFCKLAGSTDFQAILNEMERLTAERDRYRGALDRVQSESHCWIIREESAPFLAPVYYKFRSIAREALEGK